MEFKENRPLYRLAEIAAALRAPDGCAWDREQTFQTLKPYLIEESYEAYDAIEKGDPANLREELGDLMFQVFIHAQIAREQGLFTIDDVAEGITEKLIRRHPHVFGEDKVTSAREVIDRWEKIKKKEKSEGQSILEGVPGQLPALLKAYRVQQKASRIGFDWERIEDVFAKLDEEVGELREAAARGDREEIVEEAGDILFSIVNVLRHAGINPEEALRKTTQKFMDRFRYIEQKSAELKRAIDSMNIEELDALWNEAKKSLT